MLSLFYRSSEEKIGDDDMDDKLKLKDIADLAQVSPATISLVLNNREGVGAAKRQAIQKILAENGYKVSDRAKPKAQKSIFFIKYKRHSMLVDGNPGFVNAIIDAVEKECRRQGYNLVMTACGEGQLKNIPTLAQQNSTSGMLMLGTELNDEDADILTQISVPLVVIDNYLPMLDCNCITMNNEEAIFHSVSYLVSQGHRNIGFIANRMPSNNCAARRKAFEYTVKQLGLTADPPLIYEVHPTPDGAYQSICDLLKQGTQFPTALVANNDSIALGAMKAFKEFDIKVPEDLSIIGFDGIPFSSLSDPPLTTMEVFCVEMGIWAVRILCDRIRYPFSSVTKMQIGTKLLERCSVAPIAQMRPTKDG